MGDVSYQYQCIECNESLDLGEHSKISPEVLIRGISHGYPLAEMKKQTPKVWDLLFGNNNLILNFLVEHSGYLSKHQVCLVDQQDRLFNIIGEVCSDCKMELGTLWYEPPFDSCHQKHLDYWEKRKQKLKELAP